MITKIKYNSVDYFADLNKPIDISIPIDPEGVLAWGMQPVCIEPVSHSGWIGDVEKGSAVNFNNIFFNPHAHTTHTECVGHISSAKESINQELKNFFFISKLITIKPKKKNNDCVITKNMIQNLVTKQEKLDALIIRTLPNKINKMCHNYSNSNPPYLLKEAAKYMSDINIKHLLIDLPSIDREKDSGKLNAHKLFWGFPDNIRHGCTITELIYAGPIIIDGYYLLNLQFAPFENDASPSRPVLFQLQKQVNEQR